MTRVVRARAPMRAGPVALLAAVVLAAAAVPAAVAAPAAPAPSDERQVRLEQRRDSPQTTVDDVGATVMCPSCDTTLDQSDSPAADRMRTWVRAAVEAGWTEQEIRDGLVAEYGGDESILAAPRREGVGLLAWLVPALVAAGAALVALLTLRSWRRRDHARRTRPDDTTGAA